MASIRVPVRNSLPGDTRATFWRTLQTFALTRTVITDEVHRALRMRAAEHGRSTEAEVREILERAVKSEQRVRMGDALAALGQRAGLTNDDFAVFDTQRDKAPAEPMKFE